MRRHGSSMGGSVAAGTRIAGLAFVGLLAGGVSIAGCLGGAASPDNPEGAADAALVRRPPPPRDCIGECAAWRETIDKVRRILPSRERIGRARVPSGVLHAITSLYDALDDFIGIDPRDSIVARRATRRVESVFRGALGELGHGGGGREPRPGRDDLPAQPLSFGEECLDTCGDFGESCLDNASQANIPVCAATFLACIASC
jgi:hypothetical protein